MGNISNEASECSFQVQPDPAQVAITSWNKEPEDVDQFLPECSLLHLLMVNVVKLMALSEIINVSFQTPLTHNAFCRWTLRLAFGICIYLHSLWMDLHQS